MELIGFIAGILSLVGFLPQAIKAVMTRQTDDLSLTTFIMVGISALLWVVYGLSNQLPAIWITNIVVAISNFVIVCAKLANTKK